MTMQAALDAFSTLAAMSGPGALRLTLLAASIGLALAGCGDDSGGGEIPPETATALRDSLERVEEAQAAQDCDMAEDAAGDFSSRVDDLGDDVDESIRDSLDQGAERVSELVNRDVCEQTGTTDGQTTEPVETVPTEPETTTETTTEEPTTTAPEEEEDGGENGENGGPQAEPPPESEQPPEGEEDSNAPPGPEGNPNAPDGGVGAEE